MLLQGSWVNSGSVTVTSSGTLTTGGTWTDGGVLSAVDSTVNLGGDFNLSALSQFTQSNSTVNITGMMDLKGQRLLLNGTTGSWNLVGGTISNGSIDFADDPDTDPEFSPRVKFTSMPTALRAEEANNADTVDDEHLSNILTLADDIEGKTGYDKYDDFVLDAGAGTATPSVAGADGPARNGPAPKPA